MRILAISDVHNRLETLGKIKKILIHNAIDLVLIAGDLTNYGGRKETAKVLETIGMKSTLAIPGNLDTQEALETLEEKGLSIHAKKKHVGEFCFIGFGGGISGTDSGSLLFPEKEIEETVGRLIEKEKNAVLAIHVPPFNTKLDMKGNSQHIGSKTVKLIIEKFQPKLFLCGHVHESFGMDRIGKTVCVNVAAVKDGRAAVIELGKKTLVRLIQVDVQ